MASFPSISKAKTKAMTMTFKAKAKDFTPKAKGKN